MNPIEIIALSGRSRSGKDTVARHLADKYDAHRVAFADLLKYHCNKLFDTPFCPTEVERAAVVDTWVKFGEFCRAVNPDVWIRPVLSFIRCYREYQHTFVVSDLRFERELEALRAIPDCTVRCWNIIRPGVKAVGVDGYRPASAIDLINDGTVEQLLARAEAAWEFQHAAP